MENNYFGSDTFVGFGVDYIDNDLETMGGNIGGPNTPAVAVPEGGFDTDWTTPDTNFQTLDTSELVTGSDSFGIKTLSRNLMQQSDLSTDYLYTNISDLGPFTDSFSPVFDDGMAEVKQENTPKSKRGRKSKSNNSASNTPACTSSAHVLTTGTSMSLRDIKPAVASTSQGVKRMFDEDSNFSTSSSTPTKKQKKYELDDTDNPDPSIKNAKAAKLNREKKKCQIQMLIIDNEETHKKRDELEATVVGLQKQMEELKRDNELMKTKLMAASGLQRIGPSMKDFLTTIMAPLQQDHGRFQLEFSPTFDELPLALAPLPGQEQVVENPSQIFTTHIDMTNRRIMVDYDPCFSGYPNTPTSTSN